MKKHNLLTIISLLTISISCGGDKKNLFSIDETQFKALYHSGEEISVAITNKNEKNIDSISFLITRKELDQSREIKLLNTY
ncbi:hypothetical protein [Flavobacterium oreochromis]|uniref:hypothetical protein n=1 Tax=Flavobacterium oreochromis TaxID=2906078 RepID=UPI002869970B|nr:hypothetical protein [Flavobacterium oreochromis]